LFPFSPGEIILDAMFLKKSFGNTEGYNDINQGIPNQVIGNDYQEKLYTPFAQQFFKTEFLNDQDTVDDVVLI
jgi:hypothetical protein